MAKAYVVGTCDTKGAELRYVRDLIAAAGVPTVLVDLGTRSDGRARRRHAAGGGGAPPGGRGRGLRRRSRPGGRRHGRGLRPLRRARGADIGGMIGLGGSGGTALITPAMRALPVGLPKVMVSTVASRQRRALRRPRRHLHDVLGHRRRRAQPDLAPGAGQRRPRARRHGGAPGAGGREDAKPALGLTMFGVTTPCVEQVAEALAGDYDCLVFHATGTGGQSLEKLVDSGLVAGVIDVTTTEVCDLLMGGVFSAGEDRLGAIARTGVPYVGSCGALDMVNFGALETVPERYRGRNLYVHNPQVTLMRTTPEENRRIGAWIGGEAQRLRGRGALPDARRAASRCSTRRASRSTTRPPTPRCSTRSRRPCGRPRAGA